MTDRIALVLALAFAAAVFANIWFDWGLHIFLGRKLIDLTDYLAFWR